MKRILTSIITFALLAVISVSCQKEVDQDSYGYLFLSVTSDDAENVIVKASEPVTEPYIVEIYNSSGDLVEKIDNHTALTESSPLKLLIGTYTVRVMNRERTNASFTEYFAAEQKIKVLPDKTVGFDVTCSRADCRFSVEFPEEFSTIFTKYEVSVTNGVGEELILSNSPDASDPHQASLSDVASFDVTGQLTWSLYLKNVDSAEDNDKGGIYTYTHETYNYVSAGSHYHLNFSLAEPEQIEGVFALRVVVNGEMIEELHEIKIDFDQKGKPSYTANEGFDIPSEEGEYMTVIFESATDKYLTFDTPAGLKHLYVSHYDEDLTKVGLPQRTDLYQGTQAEKDQLTLLGISHNVGELSSVVNLTNFIKTLPQGLYDFSVTAIDTKGRYAKCRVPVEIVLDVDAEAFAVTPWGRFAFVEARYFTDPAAEGLTFQYRHVLDTDWITLGTSTIEINPQIMRYTGRIDGLEPDSEYVFRAMSQKDIDEGKVSKELTFRTDIAQDLYNLDFDDWVEDAPGFGSGKVWYPNDNLKSHYIWDSANASGMSKTTSPEYNEVAVVKENGAAAKLTSIKAAKFAAGNIFTGQFGKVDIASLGAELNWGTPFESRPIALKVHYKYSPQTIENASGTKYADQQGKTDQCQILICLTDWDSPFLVSTGKEQFVNFDTDEGVIAFGALYSDKTDTEYQKFTIPLVYRDVDRKPKYIIVACAASRYGDYFVGGVNSTLLVDEFELIYDPADPELSDEDFEKVFANIE